MAHLKNVSDVENDPLAPVPHGVLALKVPPCDDEPLYGWLCRAARMLGYPSVDRLGSILGGRVEDLVRDPSCATRLARALSVEQKLIEHHGCWPNVERTSIAGQKHHVVAFFGTRLASAHFRVAKVRICPRCLMESAHQRNIWDLALCVSCPKHGCLLLDVCPGCKDILTDGYHRLGLCKCGFPLKQAATEAAPRVLTDISSYLDFHLNGARTNQADPLLIYPFDQLSLDHFLDLLIILSTFTENALRGRTLLDAQRAYRIRSVQELVPILLQTGELLVRWPSKFEERLLTSMDALPRGGAHLEQSVSVSSLFSWTVPSSLTFLYDIVARCSQTRMRKFLEQRHESSEVATRTSGIDHEQPKMRLVNEPLRQPDVIPIRDDAFNLGTNVRNALAILQNWNTSSRTGFHGRPVSPRVTYRAEVVELWDNLNAAQNPWVATPSDQYKSFDEARMISWNLGLSCSTLVLAILEGRLRICTARGQRFALDSAMLNESDLTAWWCETMPRNHEVSIEFARRMLNVNRATFELLQARNSIQLEFKTGSRSLPIVSTRSVIEAMNDIRLLKRIEDFVGISRKEMTALLEQHQATLLTSGEMKASGTRVMRTINASALQRDKISQILRVHAVAFWRSSENSTGAAFPQTERGLVGREQERKEVCAFAGGWND
ncbi:MAG: hypothetical protein E6Q98_08645 [Rhodospirillaceae bacterium]|nr:MAG: hypothetical protein E6Q98_08645 [Rhodospirillaceae bacterium]